MRHGKRVRARVRRRGLQRNSRCESLEPRQLLAARVVINEVMYHAASGQDRDEWIELYNSGDAPANLLGFRINEGIDFSLPDMTLGAAEFLVVAADVEAFRAQYPDVANVVGGWTGRLSNRSESIALVDAAGNLVDLAKYADSGDWGARRRETDPFGVPSWTWLAPHDGLGPSAELANPNLPRDVGHNWTASSDPGGTPGQANRAASSDIAPAIADVRHGPVIPTSNDEVTITARIVDESQPNVTATLYYRESTLTPGAFLPIAMSDDGEHGDGGAGDGIFAAIIPAMVNETVVEFYVEATDSGGARRTSPAPSDEAGNQQANYLYQVDDAEHPADVPLFRTIMTVADRADFNRQVRASDALANATFIVSIGDETEFRYNAGVRYRGSGTRDNAVPNNRINLPSDRPWEDTTQLNVNSNAPQNQIAGSTLFSLAELPVADAIPVRMLSNERDLARGGFYAYVEVLNGDWADRHFPNDSQGNVYRGRRAGEGPPGGLGAGLAYVGDNQSFYVSYLKGTNSSQADYSDVVELTDVLNNTPDDEYLERVQQVANVDQWLRAIATIDLTGYGEFSLLTGDAGGDDYAMYRGIDDPRFVMLPYDLDEMFSNTAVLRALNVPALNRLLNHPEIRPRYAAQVLDLIERSLTPERVRAALEEVLGPVRSESQLNTIVNFLVNRAATMRNLFPTELTANIGLQPVDGFYRTSEETTGSFSGTAHGATTRRVEVNGLEAQWDGVDGTWSVDAIPLEPGFNRVQVTSFNSEGEPTETLTLDILRATDTADVSETIASDTTWTAAGGPYQISGEVTVTSAATLTIEPGTAIWFGNNARLRIEGQIVAAGTSTSPIWFSRTPGTGGTWSGLQFRGSSGDNRIHYAVLQYGQTDDGMIGLENSRLTIDHSTLANSTRRRIRSIDSSLIVRNSTFATIAAPGQAPATDNLSEHIWGRGIPADGQWILDNNRFEHTTGHNDLIDFDAPRLPNPIPIIRNNVFAGSGDDALDMTGDVYIEGNRFENFRKDEFNLDPGESNTISASGGIYFVIGNVFHNVQHASLVKEQAFMHFINNTVVQSERAPLYFDLPGQTSGPGIGARVEGSVFYQNEGLFDAVRPTTDLTLNYSFVPPDEVPRGVGNRTGDPQLNLSDERLGPLAGSPLLGAGPQGTDMGAPSAVGAVITRQPPAMTSRDNATLRVGGAGIVNYRYRLNDGPWSDPRPIEMPIELLQLADGEYTVEVVGQNLIDQWQDDADAASSRTWRVDSTLTGVQINEVLASNRAAFEHQGTFPDLVELHNVGRNAVDLSGLSLTDDPATPQRFVFPPGTILGGGEYLVLFADSGATTPGIHLGFALSDEGEGVYLYDATSRGGQLLDSVEFGRQATDVSIGVGDNLEWTITRPTFGAANEELPQSDPAQLRINEWLANADVATNNDFVELRNAGFGPIDLGGLFLTDSPASWPNRHQFPPLSVIGGGGFAAFEADGDPEDGPDHVDFRLSRLGDMVGLYHDQGQAIDTVHFAAQRADVSQGFSLTPDGDFQFTRYELPTPGLANPSTAVGTATFVPIDANWRYDQSDQDLGTEWREPDYDDSTWPSGAAGFYVETSAIPAPKNTALELGAVTYYFRHEFLVDDPAVVQSLELNAVIDDGMIVYLNGTEVFRLGLPAGNVGHTTVANRTVSNADVEGPFAIPAEALVAGRNVLAVELHQQSTTSSDVVMALNLNGQVQQDDVPAYRAMALQRDLRITELMYNPLGNDDNEFIEVQNIGEQPLQLAGLRLAGGVDFVFPPLELGAGEFAVVVADVEAFRQRYGNLALVAGEYDRSLSNDGEEIQLVLPAPYPTNILLFEYSDGWYPETSAGGFSLVIDDPLAPRRNWSEPAAWRASNFVNGSPGFVDAGLDVGILKINEILANTAGAAGDQIEILNTTSSALDISGWHLSNDAQNLTKYRLPEGVVIPPEGSIVFAAADQFGAQFTLSDFGGEVLLASPDAVGAVAGFVVSQEYGAAELEMSWGRYVRSDGADDFVVQTAPSLGSENLGPLVDSMVISEIDYSPASGDEFIELHNRGANLVSLFAAGAPDRTWSLGGDIAYTMPAGVELSPGGFLLIVGGDPEAFRQAHNVPAEVTILGPYAGSLDDLGAEIQLLRPLTLQPDISLLVDRVGFTSQLPWPSEAGDGPSSLIRVPLEAYGNDPAHWAAGIALGTPGRANQAIDTSPATAPSQLAWLVAAGPAIHVSWAASDDPETGVVAYNVYRDQELIGTSATTEFVDATIAAPAAYSYHITAINAQGLESDVSEVLDVRVMSIESINSRFNNQVVVRFTEPVVQESAEEILNYQIDGIQVLDAQLAADAQTLSLTTSPMQLDAPYRLIVQNIVGVAGTPLPPGLEFLYSYREGVPGFTVQGIQVRQTTLRSLADVDSILAQPPGSNQIDRQFTDIYGQLNFSDDDGHATSELFGDNLPFPTDEEGEENNFLIHATGFLVVPPEQAGVWTFAANVDAPQTTEAYQQVVPLSSTWKYSDRGEDLGTAWREPAFDDAAWQAGQAPFGYGDGDETTQLNFGPDPNNKVPTYYFRSTFNLDSLQNIVRARGSFQRDDGAAVYVNGVEVTRQNLGPNAAFGDLAPLENEPPFESAAFQFEFDPSVLREGENVLAVEVHQSSRQGEDIRFDLGLELLVRESASDDGFRLLIDGNPVIYADAAHGASARLGAVELSPGAHAITFDFFEATEGAEVELFAAPGTFRAVADTDLWQLVGDRAAGGLGITTDPLPPLPLAWDTVGPDGALLEKAETLGALKGFDVPVGYAIELLADELLSAVVQPDSPEATLTVRVRNSVQTLQTSRSAAAGAPVMITGVAALNQDFYVLEISSDVPTNFQLKAHANALGEEELVSPGGTNDTAATAQQLGTPRTSVLGVEQWAVHGESDEGGGADVYAIALQQGDIISAAAAGDQPAPSQLELFSSDLTRLAVGVDYGTSNVIADFRIPVAGTYFFRVAREGAATYRLAVTRGAGLDAAMNESLSTATLISPTQSMVGAVGTEFPGLPAEGTQTSPVPLLLTDGEGHQWSIQSEGYIGFDASGAYDFGLFLSGAASFNQAVLEESGRELVLGPSQLQANLSLTRKVYVSPALGFARYLEVFTNTGDFPVTWSTQLFSNLGSDTGTQLVATSSGDGEFNNADHWLITDDADGRNDPTLFHMFSGPGGLLPDVASLTSDQLDVTFGVQLDPGETQIFMHFAARSADRAAAMLKAATLSDLAGGALAGMSLEEIAQVVNFQVNDVLDSYSVYLTAGQQVTWTTETPADDDSVRSSGAPIDPALTLFDPSGNELAADDDGAADGRNAQLTWTATVDGLHVVQVSSRAGTGGYRLTSSVFNEPPLHVVNSEPRVGLPVGAIPNLWRLDFSSSVDLTTIEPGDLLINDLPADTVEVVDGDSLRFAIDPALIAGAETITVRLADQAVSSYGGAGNELFEAAFVVDPAAPRVVDVLWNDAALPSTRLMAAGPLQIAVEFNELVRSNNLDPNDVTILVNETGQSITPFSMEYDETANRLLAGFSLSEGDYTLVVASGDGAIEDIAGNDLDGDSLHGLTPSGDGSPGGDYRVPFRVDEQTIDLGSQWVELRPAGSLAMRIAVSNAIAYADDVDTYQVHLSPGDRLSVSVGLATPNIDSGMQVEVRDPWGRIVAHNSVGADGLLPGIEDVQAMVGGPFQVRIAGGDVGESYGLTLFRNVVSEAIDSSVRRPAAIDDSAPRGPVRRYAVIGSSQPMNPSTLVWGVQPSSRQIVVVDPLTGDIALSFPAPGNLQPAHTRLGLTMADLGQTLLYINADDEPTRVYQLDPMSGEVRGTLAVETAGYDGLGFEAGKLFLAEREGDIVRQTVAGDPPVGSWSTGAVRGGLGGDDYGRVFGLFADGMIREFDPNVDRDEYILSMPAPMNDLEGLAFDGTLLYASSASGALLTLAPDEPGAPVVREVDVEGGALFGLAGLGEHGGSSSGDGRVAEQEPNNSRTTAQNLDGAFSLAFDADIGDFIENTSTVIPHVTVRGRGTGNVDFYAFTVTDGNTRGLFDIDNSVDSFDPYLRLRDSQGNIIAENDDSQPDEGSSSSLDSFIDFTFPAAGVYLIEVASCCVGDVPASARYDLHVSIQSAALLRSQDVDMIAAGSEWKYWDQATSPGDNWASGDGVDDSNWLVGRGQLGYGDGDEQTVVSFGPDGNNKLITTYFRKSIEIADPDAYSELWIDLLYDDAAAVYINGQLALTENLPSPFSAASPAATAREGNDENEYQQFTVDPQLLRAGANVIAVEVHQSSPADADLSFDLRLHGRVNQLVTALPEVAEHDVYTVDLTGSAGHPIDILVAGQQGVQFEAQSLRLFDATGRTLLAEAAAGGDDGPTNVDLAIRDFVVPADGVYTLVVESDIAGSYLLLLADGAAFDSEPNAADAELLRPLAIGQAAFGIALPQGPSSIEDPEGDALPGASLADIASLAAQIEDDALVLTVEFHHGIQASPGGNDAVFVYIELDTDQDPATGAPSFQNQEFVPGQPGGPLGVEFAVNASSLAGSQAALLEPVTGQVIATVPMILTDTAFRLEIPLAQLGDDGLVNLGVISGGIQISDAAPNETFLTSQMGGGGETPAEADAYRLSLTQGERHRVTAEILPGVDGQPSGAAYVLSVLDPAGNVVASDEVAAGSRRYADVLFTAPATGDYRAVVEVAESAIRYVLTHEPIAGPAVLARHLFYNHSSRDGDDPQANEADDAAVAWDKAALLPGKPLRIENVSNFVHGINGIMIDLAAAPGALTIDDFGLRIGNSDQPGSWTDAPLPAGFLVRPGAGTARSDRVMIVWNDGAIRDQWLEVTVRATAATGLAQPDVFYFGSLVGETGDALEPIVVSSIDHIGVHRLARSIGPSTGYFEAFDLNRDGQVDAQDVAAVPPVTNRGLAPVFGIEPGAVDPVFELGDANLDGRFDIDDLMLALQLGEFEDLFAGNSTWSAGDWDGDGDFTTRDLVFAFQQGGFAG